LVIAAYSCYALFLPAFEGPDEPFHLSRALDFAQGRFWEGWYADHLNNDLLGAVSSFPCGPDLQKAFGCSALASRESSAWGNLLDPPNEVTRRQVSSSYPNYERQHPVLGYLVWSAPVAAVEHFSAGRPATRRVAAAQLAVRFVNLAILGLALLGPGRRLVKAWSEKARLVAGGILLLPGAVETLARGGLEALVLAWSLWFVEECLRESPRTLLFFCLAAIGPLIKLTAVPVVAFGAMTAWWGRRRALALGVVAAGASVYLERLLRGYLAGGVLDLHSGYAAHDPGSWLDILRGLGWSMLVTAKSAVWLGGWSFFRPPNWVLALVVASILALLSRLRRAVDGDFAVRRAALGAAAVAVGGHAVFSVAVYRVFGSWAVGGWYVWAWFAVAAIAAERSLDWRRPLPRWLLPAAGLVLIVVDVAWWISADRAYG
jgi:hypothetical protein